MGKKKKKYEENDGVSYRTASAKIRALEKKMVGGKYKKSTTISHLK